MMVLALHLPPPISLNNAYRTLQLPGQRPIRVKTGKASKYESDVIKITEAAVKAQGFHAPAGARFELWMCVWFPTKAGDLDNVCKLAQDAIFKALKLNDNTIDKITIRRMPPDKKEPRAYVELTVIE